MSKPASEPCPMHMDEPPVAPVAVLNETADYTYTCPRTTGHARPGSYSWDYVAPPPPPAPRQKGVALKTELAQALVTAALTAVRENGGGWIEYGLVERAYALANPDDWAALLARYDHTHFHEGEPGHGGLKYTASKYLARSLSGLAKRGELSLKKAPGTGRWAFDNPISHFAPPDVTPGAKTCSWAASSADMGYMPASRPEE